MKVFTKKNIELLSKFNFFTNNYNLFRSVIRKNNNITSLSIVKITK